ncbi:MAG TPA: hypothetical protein VGI97_04945 [Gemmatimonadaceae bacterium]
MKRVSVVLALACLPGASAFAQRTGTLLGRGDSARRALQPAEVTAADAAKAKGDTTFAALVFDPSLVALARSSAWTASVVASGGVKDARLQANLCDIMGAICGRRGAAALMFAGPLNKNDDFTELADLDGLVNSARVQASYTTNATSVGTFAAFSATFSQPRFTYRDTAAFARRFIGHTSYAIEGGAGYRWRAVTLQGAMRWEQSYRARTSKNICTPASFGPPGTQSCENMILGPPFTRDRTVASISGAWSIGGNAAARLTIAHDVRHGITGIDLPVWLVTNAAGGLAGGVRFGYRTDSREMTMALFVSEFKL